MKRVFVLVAVGAVLGPAPSSAAPVPSPVPSPVPDEVALGLPLVGIRVVDATDVVSGSLPVRPQRAVRVARKYFGGFARPYTSGWVRVGRVTLHLVRVVQSSGSGLFAGELAWLVVIRDATIPILGGPPGRAGQLFYVAPLAVFVRTDEPRYIMAASF